MRDIYVVLVSHDSVNICGVSFVVKSVKLLKQKLINTRNVDSTALVQFLQSDKYCEIFKSVTINSIGNYSTRYYHVYKECVEV